MDQNDKKMELVRNQAKLLMGSFDSVQIFCTKDDKEEFFTGVFSWGEGNYFARYGQIKLWLDEQEANNIHKNIDE